MLHEDPTFIEDNQFDLTELVRGYEKYEKGIVVSLGSEPFDDIYDSKIS